MSLVESPAPTTDGSSRSPEGTVRIEVEDPIGWLYFNRPEKRNAMNPVLNAEMPQALETLERDDRVRVGGLSGSGRATAVKLAAAGAKLILVARDLRKLEAAAAEIHGQGGQVSVYACDLTDAEASTALIAQLLGEHGHVDVLINNAGRSIRRAIENTYERLHDYERLMRINYFAAVRLTLGLLPSMAARGTGHVISISSIGVLSNAARFAAYNASKAALEAFTRCAAAEYRDRGIRFTVINMPLVRTSMVAPTQLYRRVPLLQPQQAADIVGEALMRRPARLTTPRGKLAQLIEALAPEVGRAVMSESYRLFPESEAAGGAPGAEASLAPEAAAFAALLHGSYG